MLPSATPSLVEPLPEAENFTPRRIRHITGIQIRNLTPFPVRDSFTTALAQPVEQSYFSVSGTTDDLGTIVSRKRTRKTSTASSKTRHSLNREDESFDVEFNGVEPRARRSSNSTITYPSNGQVSTSPNDTILSASSSSRSSTFRRARPRTSSMSSFGVSQTSNALLHNTSASVTTSSFLLSDNSQSVLKRVIDSRLIETFVTVFVPARRFDAELKSEQKPPRSAPTSKSSFSSTSNRPAQTLPLNSRQSTTVPSSARTIRAHKSPPDSAPPSRTTFKTTLIGAGENATRVRLVPHARSNRTSAVFQPSSNSGSSSSKSVEGESSTRYEDSLPAFFSPIHRPSTNPFFPIDPRSDHTFPHPADTSGQRLRIEVWGKVDPAKGQHKGEADFHQGWKILDEWDFSLDSLVPLPVDLDANPSLLPSNTLILSLSPPGQSFYLPSPSSSSSSSRSSTPTAGYTSDPESVIRRVKRINENKSDSTEQGELVLLSRRRHRSKLVDSASQATTKTAGWQDLFKLVSLQSCIIDNENSARDVVQKVDVFLAEDRVFPLRRQISEREAKIEDLKRDRNFVFEELRKKRQQITERKQRLKDRRTLLDSAFDESVHDPQLDNLIQEERNNTTSLYRKINSSRTTLLSTLSNIYPIELYSPPDLLYTILDVPLPIPVSPNDPAPPLSLLDHKEVTEEATATALGYVAQVLQILAAYIGKKLIYPVTCIGSRSLIKDGISAMVGPRMFPLFSKGVDTYRFEYGVFLLNKDIEMVMSERDLRALDIRHTLPNLKNLILTLSHDANAIQEHIQPRSSISKIPNLETHLEDPRLEAEDTATPKASRTLHFNRTESTPPQSGSATPTTITDESRKQKSFLGFVPFSDYLWTRNPSTTQSESESSTEDVETSDDAASLIDHDEDDRKTIQGVVPDEIRTCPPDLDFS